MSARLLFLCGLLAIAISVVMFKVQWDHVFSVEGGAWYHGTALVIGVAGAITVGATWGNLIPPREP